MKNYNVGVESSTSDVCEAIEELQKAIKNLEDAVADMKVNTVDISKIDIKNTGGNRMKPIINVDASNSKSGDKVIIYISNKFEVPLDYDGPKIVNERQGRAVGLLPELGYDTFVYLKGNGGVLNLEIVVNDQNETYYETVDAELLDTFNGR